MIKRKIFFAGFFLTFSAALSYYVNSSFLSRLVGGDKWLGLIYAAAAIGGGGLILILTRFHLIEKIGWRRLSCWLGLILASGYLSLSFISLSTVQLVSFIFVYTAIVGLSFLLDLALEQASRDAATGRIRGGYLTIINAAVLFAPLVSGATLDYFKDFRFIYFLCFIAVLPLLYQLFFKFDRSVLVTVNFAAPKKLNNPNLRRILKLDFLLNLFFFVMVIYLPLHLHNNLGFSWEKIGLIFTIMLVPFVLIEYPLGWLADKRWGEKEILTAGLMIVGLATLPIAWLTSTNWLIWAGLLFLTRVGASAWESMKET
ncbi:MAG: MFS transporter, partial [Patescibacteria group bacterium]